MTPFNALYGYEELNFADLDFGDIMEPKDKYLVQESQDILKVVKENLQVAQIHQNLYLDRQRIERSFEVGDLVYLRLQPYRQSSLKKKGAKKLENLAFVALTR